MIGVVLVLLAKGTFCDVTEGVNSKHFSLAPLACSRLPSFHKNNVTGLWFLKFTISRTNRETASVYSQLR